MYLVMQEEKVRRKLAESGVHSYDEECRRKYQIYLQRHVCQNSTKYKFNMYIFLISRWLKYSDATPRKNFISPHVDKNGWSESSY